VIYNNHINDNSNKNDKKVREKRINNWGEKSKKVKKKRKTTERKIERRRNTGNKYVLKDRWKASKEKDKNKETEGKIKK
jgi:hypothetical protein